MLIRNLELAYGKSDRSICYKAGLHDKRFGHDTPEQKSHFAIYSFTQQLFVDTFMISTVPIGKRHLYFPFTTVYFKE